VSLTASAKIRVRLQPRARANEIVGERGGALLVRVTAPPVEGRANDALCKLLARRAGVGRTRVTIVRGKATQLKLVRIEGIAADELERALGVTAGVGSFIETSEQRGGTP
jgi:uncharacterized protein (TIGR00251 family)